MGAVAEGSGSGCDRPLSGLAGASVRPMTPSPIPAHRTGRADFPHPALRLVSRSGTRTRPQLQRSQPQDSQFSEDPLSREAPDAARWHLVAASEEVPHAVIDVVVHSPIGHCACPMAEVGRPASQRPVQAAGDLGPGSLIARPETSPDLLLDPPHALLRRLCGQIPVAIFPVTLRPEGIAQEVERFPARIADTRLGLIEVQADGPHRPPRPRQSLRRVSQAEDDEVVGIGDDLSLVLSALSSLTPGPEEPVHVDVGQKRADHATLRRAVLALLASTHAPVSPLIPLL